MKETNDEHKAGWNLDNSYARLPKKFYTKIDPVPVRDPELIILNQLLAKDLGLSPSHLKDKDGVAEIAGNKIPTVAEPLAQAYAGHQFGHFTMLGDGRAVLIGEQVTPSEVRFDIQLKGSGRTPYSRRGDGRATLGPMLREYIIAEAMYALGIPTTRSLAVVTTGEEVRRETYEKGAILTRVAASHIRVGTFQYIAQWGTVDELKALADYTLERHFEGYESVENRYLYLLRQVIKRQADLISRWMLVGFVHGVMNTDNMTISGETIDYGPCAFMDTYDPATVFSSIDVKGRYAYGNQPNIGAWNLARLAESLLPLLHENQDEAVKIAQEEIETFPDIYRKNWLVGMRSKLGLFSEEEQDQSLINELLNLMKEHKADYTNTFRALSLNQLEGQNLFESEEFLKWHLKWNKRLEKQEESKEEAQTLMKKSNPAIIPRNYRVEEALEAAVDGDYCTMERLLDVLSNPYEYTKEQDEYATLPEASDQAYVTYCGT
ncbi:protein adenylyltransferase SelO [Haloplasma contractile]|uniref:Protein nucleotidyltransferase YdiU n=1 Tax=Haloplasma contractile SSD-17B TaxID=1033810 RepID=U2E7P2_9MOLU|nr:YdiU family protein [Haloplasma contractile]ERJ10916.1 putative ACR protein [Haloplasma contractile SSD-17B]